MYATWWSNSSGSWILFGSNWIGFATGTNITQVFDNATTLSTIYYWSLNLTDSFGWNNETYTFTTGSISDLYYSMVDINAILEDYYTETESDNTFLSALFELDYTSIMFLLWMFLIVLSEWKNDWAYKILQLPIGLTYGVTLLDSDIYLGLCMIFASIYIMAIAYWQSRKGE